LGNDWRPEAHIEQTMKMTNWEKLKEIARKRRLYLARLQTLDDEEKAIRSEIEAGNG
jgi:hypothetical protein